MNLEQQVCSLELAQKLKNLGVKQESYFYHCPWSELKILSCKELGKEYTAELSTKPNEDTFAAFTVAELGEMLYRGLVQTWKGIDGKWYCVWRYTPAYLNDENSTTFEADIEADARAKMLVYLIEHNLLTV